MKKARYEMIDEQSMSLYRRVTTFIVMLLLVAVFWHFIDKTFRYAMETAFQTRAELWRERQTIFQWRWVQAGRPERWRVDGQVWTMTDLGWPAVYSVRDCENLWSLYLAEPISEVWVSTHWIKGECQFSNRKISIKYNYIVKSIALVMEEE